MNPYRGTEDDGDTTGPTTWLEKLRARIDVTHFAVMCPIGGVAMIWSHLGLMIALRVLLISSATVAGGLLLHGVIDEKPGAIRWGLILLGWTGVAMLVSAVAHSAHLTP